MANALTKHIPNTITSCNLVCGCIASFHAFQCEYKLAMLFIVLGAIFDFFDGMSARLLHVSSPIGKELDSLADDITFGLAPSAMVFSLFKEVNTPAWLGGFADYLPYIAFVMAAFSALRLAKFNLDTRQTSSFIGLPTPANALFWGALIVGSHDFLISSFNAIYLVIMVLIFSYLLIAEIPMFSLKFKNLKWKDNQVTFIFLAVSVILLISLRVSGFAAVIIWYIALSLLNNLRKNKA